MALQDQVLNLASFILQATAMHQGHPRLAYVYGSFNGARAPVLLKANRWTLSDLLGDEEDYSCSPQDLLKYCSVWESFTPRMRNRAYYDALHARINNAAHPDLLEKFNVLSVHFATADESETID